jgi:phage tail sheath protein FI
VIAQRSLQRGAWIAPANEPLRGVVALEPPINRARFLDLQEAHINLVRQEPRGFVVLDADTLSDDVDLRLINVRRLLVLLRRQALRLGMTYVFEPNSPAFRRLVERGFTDMLDQMFIRGAFAGATPKSSYQVVADDSVNTERSVEQGRFIVELRVAPSLPLNFLTIRLIQNGDRTSVREGR